MSSRTFLGGKVRIHHGDSREVLRGMADNSIDSVVCDPPYALVSIVKRYGYENAAPTQAAVYARAAAGFMGKSWDNGATAFAVEFWAEVLRVVKPGGHVLAFSGTRTYHRLAVAIEDAGFEIRDMTAWLYGSGFPKSHDVSKGIDKAAGAERMKVRVDAADVRNPKATGAGRDGMEGATRPWIEAAMERGYHEIDGDEPATPEAAQWQGWGTALKPALEPIVLARKPLIGTVAANVLTHGTGAINIDGCRVGTDEGLARPYGGDNDIYGKFSMARGTVIGANLTGRWPANVIHDGSADVLAAFPETTSGTLTPDMNVRASTGWSGGSRPDRVKSSFMANEGSAARFFYTAKADSDDRIGSKHPTVKPVDLMRYLCRLVTPPGGTVLDPFAGTGTTGEAAWLEGFQAILIEREAEYIADIERRMALCLAGPVEKAHTLIKAKGLTEAPGPLFAKMDE